MAKPYVHDSTCKVAKKIRINLSEDLLSKGIKCILAIVVVEAQK